jgi:ribonuclease HII
MRSHPLEVRLKKEGIFCFAGIDESGRGPWAGPLVAAAVILPSGTRIPGLDDSKKLTSLKREALFAEILKKASVGVGIVSNKSIDKKGLGQCLKLAYKKAISNLSRQPKYVLIDGIGKYNLGISYTTIKKGDTKVRCIAAASIVAKVVRDTIMHSYALKYPKYGFSEHKGYGTRQHHQNLLQYGTCSLHRKSFAPIKDVLYGSKTL